MTPISDENESVLRPVTVSLSSWKNFICHNLHYEWLLHMDFSLFILGLTLINIGASHFILVLCKNFQLCMNDQPIKLDDPAT